MVKLLPESSIDPKIYPTTYQWDTVFRKNYDMHQKQIDKQTYHIQRLQRLFYSYPYPINQDSEVVTLNLLKKKQLVGEVQKNEVQLYQSINPCIRNQYSRTFSLNCGISNFGYGLAGGIFAFTSFCNYTIQARVVLTALPLLFQLYRNSRDTKVEVRSSEFLDWVIGFRRSKSFAERYNNLFQDKQLKKIIGNGNLVELGEQLVNSVTL